MISLKQIFSQPTIKYLTMMAAVQAFNRVVDGKAEPMAMLLIRLYIYRREARA